MSEHSDIAETLLRSARFRDALDVITVQSLLDDLPLIPELSPGTIDWNYALLCSSALTTSGSEAAIEVALRVVQGCLSDALAKPIHRQAAAVLLERMGNRRAVELAERRGLLAEEAWTDVPPPLRLDVIRRRIELTIPLATGEGIAANPFQREFWTSAREHLWLSVSAPTSAGKSYIVKRWFEDRALNTERFRGVYLVPTRALVDEVSRNLRQDFSDMTVFVIPWDSEIGSHAKEIYVMTQERLHLLQERDHSFTAELLFIDEAQKIGDGDRGVLLQRVLDEAVRRKPNAQVLFASPSSRNPELLLEGAPEDARPHRIVSEMVTVNQNLLWVNQSPNGKRWIVELVTDGEPRRVGEIELAARPTTTGKRLPLVAVALGDDQPGNLVYANGAADAEKTAMQIADVLSDRVNLCDHPGVFALQELVTKTIHRDYRLGPVLNSGVAFHYGNMPLTIRTEIERLFRDGVLLYLVCTSTLLEGINLPCRNLFARGPTRGAHRPMTIPDFWNLAGRAGRWGTEFRGNVVCVDTSKDVWQDVPRRRVRQSLTRASDEVLLQLGSLDTFIDAKSPADAAREEPLMASVFSFLATRVRQGRTLSSIPGITLGETAVRELEARIRHALEPVELPSQLMARHAGISPTAMQVLLDYFRGHENPETLPLAMPESPKSELSYTKAMSRSRDYLGTESFGGNKRCAMLGILVRDWMLVVVFSRVFQLCLKAVKLRNQRQKLIDGQALLSRLNCLARCIQRSLGAQ